MPNSLMPLGLTEHAVDIPPETLQMAMDQLSHVIQSEAQLTARRVGFGWRARPDAPDGYDRLRAAYRHSKRTGQAMPISNLHCERTIFGAVETNVAMRFWHDIHHVERGCDFSPLEEIELALWHLDVLSQRGLSPSSLAWRLLQADLIGQTYCSALLGRFPDDQRQFVLDCVTGGLDWALLAESARDPLVAAAA